MKSFVSYNTLDKEALRETLLNLANNKVKVKALSQ